MSAYAMRTYTDDLPTISSVIAKTSQRFSVSENADIFKYAGQAFKLAVEKSSLAEPFISWTSDLEPTISTLYLGINYANLNDEHIELTDQDIPLPTYCSRAAQAFEHYESLEDGWDGDDAITPSKETLNNANYFLRILGSNISSLAEARPMLDAEGIPGIFWSTEKKYLSISFYGEFSLTYFSKLKNSSDSAARTISLHSSEDISSLLSIIEEL